MPSATTPSTSLASDLYRAELDAIRAEEHGINTNTRKLKEEAEELAALKRTGDADDEVIVSRATVLSMKRPMRESDSERRQQKIAGHLATCANLLPRLRDEVLAPLQRAFGDFEDGLDRLIPSAWFRPEVFYEVAAGGAPEQPDTRRGEILAHIVSQSDFGLRMAWVRACSTDLSASSPRAAQAALGWFNTATRLLEDLKRHTGKLSKAA